MKEVILLRNKKSLIINGLTVIFLISMIMPYNALSIQQRDEKVSKNLSSVSTFDLINVEDIKNIDDISLGEIYINDDTFGGKTVSRSVDDSMQKIEPTATVAAIDTTKSSINTSHESNTQTETPQPTTISSSDAQSIIREVALANNCTQSEIDLLLIIAEKESSFRADAISPNGNCVGLFQLDSNKGSKSQRLDPRYNTNKAIEYMRARYGSIQGAYNFRLEHNWY